MSFLTGWLPSTDLLGWLGLGGVAGLGVLWWLGVLPVIIQALSVVTELLRPLARAAGDGLAVVLRWLGRILWAGLLDIIDSAATILTVAALVAAFYFGGKLADDVKYAKLEARYSSCMRDLAQTKRRPSVVKEPTVKWPWETW